MPDQTNARSTTWRTPLASAIAWIMLVAVSGCVVPSVRLPWQRPRTTEPVKQPRVATAQPSKPTDLFKTASFRKQSVPSDHDAFGSIDQIASETIGAVDVEAPLDAFDWPTAIAEDHITGIAENQIAGIEQAETTPQVIDLASALGMAGGNAWAIQLARQQTLQAYADLQRARGLWLPTLQFGVGWTKHDGRIQATSGQVIETSRAALFVGGGASLGNAPLAGGSGGPLRLIANLSLADAFFQPKVANRQLSARRAGVSVAKNQALLDAGLAYVDLVDAAGQVADTQVAIDAVDELVRLTETFAEAGAGAQADADRAKTEQARLQRQLDDARRLMRSRSATLSRRLRFDPRFELQPADKLIVPLELSADDRDRETLIQYALAKRPEINQLAHEINALCLNVRQAQVQPWLPQVAVAASGGSFGGGLGSDLDNTAGRSDVDLIALWQLDSMGLGVAADRNQAASQLAQRRTQLADLKDAITESVVAGYEDVINYRTQIESSERALRLAEDSYQRNLQRVRAGEGLPIELLQAITARTDSLRDRTAAVSNFNRAQLRLIHATGRLTTTDQFVPSDTIPLEASRTAEQRVK